MLFIGDLSDADYAVLGAKGLGARTAILEFGVGGSTQILASHSLPTVPMVSVDTNYDWIMRTRNNLELLQIYRTLPVKFHLWESRLKLPIDEFDLIFVDGFQPSRKDFARQTWPLLQPGGWLLWHDCHRDRDKQEIIQFLSEHTPEIEAFYPGLNKSNLAAFQKRPYLKPENWQTGKQRWELGVDTPPDPLTWPLA